MFHDRSRFTWVPALEARAGAIRAEFDRLRDEQFLPWPEKSLYGTGWRTFGLVAYGRRDARNCRLCPETAAAVSTIPGLKMAGFSVLAPHTRIAPHTGTKGWAGYVLRAHLPVHVPSGAEAPGPDGRPRCAIRVGDDVRTWRPGEVMVFDDSVDHEAWNGTDEVRVVLLIDFKNPHRDVPHLLLPEFSAEVVAYIENDYLPRAPLHERLLWPVYKTFAKAARRLGWVPS